MPAMTPEQWRDKLSTKLAHEAREAHERRRWRDGPHAWPTPPEALRAILGRLCELAETNMCGLAVDAVAERLGVAGMRGVDIDLWRRIWQANNLDADSSIAHRDALTTESGFILVTLRDGGLDPEVTVEDPEECIVAYEPGSRRRRAAALKRFVDRDAGEVVATVWTPDEITTWRAPFKADGTGPSQRPRWELHPDFPGGPNRLGIVPMVEIRCEGELGHDVITTQRRLNMTMFRLLTVAEFQVVPQTYLIGADIERNEDGSAKNPLKRGPEHVWLLDGEDPSKVQLGQLPAADLAPLMAMIEADVTRFGAITKTPLYYVAGGLVNVSADAIRAAEAGLIAKVRDRQLAFGEAWEEAFRLTLLALDLPVPSDLETVWADAETRSLAERADAAVKLGAVGWPFAALARKMGETDTEVARLLEERDAELQSKQIDAIGQLIRAGFTPSGATAAVGVDPIEHTGLKPITVAPA